MATTVYDVYRGFKRLVDDTLPNGLILAHSKFNWQKDQIYYIDIKNATVGFSGVLYGVCTLEVFVEEKGKKKKVSEFPYGVIADQRFGLGDDLQKELNDPKKREALLRELEGVWRKVLADRLVELEKQDGQPKIVSMGYQVKREDSVVVAEFTEKMKEALGSFYLRLVNKMVGAKGSYAVIVQDVKLVYVELYQLKIATKVWRGDKNVAVPVRFTLPVYYDYFDKKMLKKLEEVARVLLSKFTAAQKTPFEFDGLKLLVMRYNGIPQTLQWLIAEDVRLSKEILDRLRLVFEREDVRAVIESIKVFKDELVQVKVRRLPNAQVTEPLFFGANGIGYGLTGDKIYRKGDETDGNLREAVVKLTRLYGQTDSWFQLVNCYDRRRKVV